MIQASFLSIEFLTQKPRKRIRGKIPGTLNSIIGISYVITFLSFSMIFFRANCLNDAIYIVSHLFSGIQTSFHTLFINAKLPHYEDGKFNLFIAVSGVILMIWGDNFFRDDLKIKKFKSRPVYVRWLLYYSILIIISWFGDFGSETFIYFKF